MASKITLGHCDATLALPAIRRLRESLNGAVTMADELEKAVGRGSLTESLLARHNKWCHTGGSWSAGMDPARSAARAMYGFVLGRLVDSENKADDGYSEVLADYRRRIEAL